MVQLTHTTTTFTFLVNGQHTKTILANCGIRHGCPLAPILFVLSLKPLIIRLKVHPGISGIPDPHQMGRGVDLAANFADDTKLSLLRASMMTFVIEVLNEFERV